MNLKFSNTYFNDSFRDKDENLWRKSYVNSYIKWIKTKRPLSLINKIEIALLICLSILIISIVMMNFLWIDKQWNYAQIINRLIDNSKSNMAKEIGKFVWLAFLGLFSVSIIRMKQILKAHKITK